MSREFMVDLSLIGLYTVWVLLPLVPAILIYWLFPNTAVAVGGPLANLTVRASGAFAAYLVVFLVTYGLVQRTEETIDGFLHPYWRITGVVQILEKDGKEMQYATYLDNIKVGTRPPAFDVAGYNLKINIPQADEFPYLVLEITNFEPAVIDLNKSPNVIKDNYHKTIEITTPLIIKQKPAERESIAAQFRVDPGAHEASAKAR
jgi:hypothetical protein